MWRRAASGHPRIILRDWLADEHQRDWEVGPRAAGRRLAGGPLPLS